MRLLQTALIVLISSSLIFHPNDSGAAAGKHGLSERKARSHSGGKKQASRPSSIDVWDRIRLGIRIPRPNPASTEPFQAVGPKSRNLPPLALEYLKTNDIIRTADEALAGLTTQKVNKIPQTATTQLSEKLRVRQVIIPQKSHSKNNSVLSSEEKYTPLGRLKFAQKVPGSSFNERLSKKLHFVPKDGSGLVKGESLFKSPSIQRIRTRLGLHPELFKDSPLEVTETVENKSKANKKLITDAITHVQQQGAIKNCGDLKKEEIASLAQQGILPEGYSQMLEQCRTKQDANYDRVSQQIAGYSQRKGILYQAAERARPFLYHIVDALAKNNMPLDLALLPIVESAYQPTAVSPKNAAGIWQFIPSTGEEYGLEQNDDYDARLDITASTQAAIRFLSGLNGHFKGDWLLSLAAYNCGQGTVDAAISRNQAEGLDTDFWSLDLPAETMEYVPRLLALSSIFADPDSYGLKLRPIKNEPYFIKVNIDREADIKQLAKKDLRTVSRLADLDHDQLSVLNTAYLKSALPERKPFTLLLPIRSANLLHQSLAFMAQSYKGGNNPSTPLFSALTLPVDPSGTKAKAPLVSLSLNKDPLWFLPSGKSRKPEVKPNPTREEKLAAKSADEGKWSVHYLDKGESLKVVAESHGITEEFLRIANKIKYRQNLPLGQKLMVPLKQLAYASSDKGRTSVLFKGI
jgi:soluble lytic murein transglycosylase-like protein